MYCPTTGEYGCSCLVNPDQYQSELGNALKVDLKASLRKVFSEHSDYTHFLIVESLPVLQASVSAVTTRLLRNPIDIANRIEPLVGPDKAELVAQLFTDHLKLAAAALKPVREGHKKATQEAVEKLYQQGDVLAEGLYLLNPKKLDLETVTRMIHEHNEFVVELATLRQTKQYEEYIMTYDEYTKHMLMIADALYQALMH
jgi:hypothetical protein